jgi:hypothetical protein
MKWRLVSISVLLVLMAAVVPAMASTITYNLTVDHCTGGCNPGAPGTSMGTVSLNDFNGTGDVLVTVSLVSPLMFVNTGLQNTIDFNLGSIGSGVTATSFSQPHFSLASGTADSYHFDGFGDFQYSIIMDTAQGAGGSEPSPLTFHILATGLTVGSFTTNVDGYHFGVDVYNPTLNSTGPIADGGTILTPEPSSLMTMGFGLLLLSLAGPKFAGKVAQKVR